LLKKNKWGEGGRKYGRFLPHTIQLENQLIFHGITRFEQTMLLSPDGWYTNHLKLKHFVDLWS